MARHYTIRKCDRCCPDGGAICDRVHDFYGDSEEPLPLFKCRNCGNLMPRRVTKRSGKPGRTQTKILAKLLEVFGGTAESEMIGSKLWVALKNPARHWMSGDSVIGTIGRNGALKLKLQRLGGDAEITTWIGVEVYLTQRSK